MTDVDRLLAEYIDEHRGGGAADPTTFLSRAMGSDRRELAALIDGYLSLAPRQQFDAAGFRGSRSERVVDELERSLGGQAGLWPALLPELRHRAGLKRAELVARLAETLGLAGREPKVATYYHQMEQGILPSPGVSDRVLAALGDIVGESLKTLREAGDALTPFDGEPAPVAMFARVARVDPTPGEPAPETKPPGEEWDEIDTLFRGG